MFLDGVEAGNTGCSTDSDTWYYNYCNNCYNQDNNSDNSDDKHRIDSGNTHDAFDYNRLAEYFVAGSDYYKDDFEWLLGWIERLMKATRSIGGFR